jgi:hypothetical protein
VPYFFAHKKNTKLGGIIMDVIANILSQIVYYSLEIIEKFGQLASELLSIHFPVA